MATRDRSDQFNLEKVEKKQILDLDGDQKSRDIVKIYNELNAAMDPIVPKLDRILVIYRDVFFENDKKLFQEEAELVHEITNQYKKSMKILTLLKKSVDTISDQDTKLVVTNIWKRGALKLQEISKSLHKQQDRRAQIVSTSDLFSRGHYEINDQQDHKDRNQKDRNQDHKDQDLKQILISKDQDQDQDQDQENRHQAILKLNQDVNELFQLFQQLSHMVDEQGTVLDTISHNIDNAKVNVIKGKDELVKGEVHQKKASSLANKTILFLGAAVIALGTILGLKKR